MVGFLHKLKPLKTKHAVLILHEGDTENDMLHLIEKHYYGRGCGFIVRKSNLHGIGSAEDTLKEAKNYVSKQIKYKKIYLIMDSDKIGNSTKIKTFTQKASKLNLSCIVLCPCIEGFFLTILDYPKTFTTWGSKKCKKTFNKNYLYNFKNGKRAGTKELSEIFSKKILEEKREHIPNLEKLISIYQEQ